MSRLSKKKKGEYGYRNDFKRRQLFKIGILVVFILAQLGARYLTDSQALKNVLTVMAIVTVLPAANLASPLVAILSYQTSSEEFHKTYEVYEEKFPILYDLVLTTKEYVMPMDVIAVHPTGIYAYCINKKVDTKDAERSINEILISQRLDPNIKITKELATFDKRIRSLKPASEYEDDGSVDYAIQTLKSLSM